MRLVRVSPVRAEIPHRRARKHRLFASFPSAAMGTSWTSCRTARQLVMQVPQPRSSRLQTFDESLGSIQYVDPESRITSVFSVPLCPLCPLCQTHPPRTASRCHAESAPRFFFEH